MKSKQLSDITWSLLELAGLLEDEDSHVYYGKTKKHIGLHPFHLTNLNVSLNEILRLNLNTYDSELQGFLLAFKNPKLLTTLGDTFYDSCFIHVDIEADFYLFKPEVGHTMRGTVIKKGYNHIGLVVHKAFSISIPKVLDGGNWPGDTLEMGQEVKFTITHIDHTAKLPFIRGSLDRENYLEGCKLLTKPTKGRKKKIANESFYDRGNESDNSCDSREEKCKTLNQSKKLEELEKQDSPEKYSKKKRHFDDVDMPNEENKKHSKKRLKISQELNHSEYELENSVSYKNSNDNVNNTDTDTSTKKKRRSEKSSKKKSLEESQISEPEFDYSTVKIKVEKDLTSNSESENTVEITKKREKKSKRQSKELEYSDSMNYSIDNEDIKVNVKSEHKKHSKKHKLPNSDISDLGVEIKVEESTESDNINESLLNNHDSHRRKSSKKHIKKSITDSESEIGNVQVKEEKNTSESEYTQEENDRKDKITKIIKACKVESKSSRSRNNSVSENYLNGSPTKHRKREKTPVIDFENITIKEEKLPTKHRKREKTPVIDFENITIKEEKLPTKHRKREKTPVIDFENVTIKEEKLDNDINYGNGAQYESNEKKSPKKSKEIYIKSEPEETQIKVEKDKIKIESEDEKGSREIKVMHEKIHKRRKIERSSSEES